MKDALSATATKATTGLLIGFGMLEDVQGGFGE
jgi:hypothetical protein